MSVLHPSPEVSFFTHRFHSESRPRYFTNSNVNGAQKLGSLERGYGIGRVRVRVCCSSVKDFKDSRVVNLSENLRLYGQLSTPVKVNTMSSSSSTTKQSKEEEEKRNYYVNTGYAIRILREEFPALFCKELNFDIYRDDIVFKDPLNTFAGIENYKSIFWALRFHGRIFFKALWIDIVSVWQPVENMIMIRWTVHGIPRVPWESRGRFDATSEYKLDKNGKIYEHRVHNIALSAPPKFRVIAVEELIQAISCPSTPKPTYFEISFPSTRNIMLTIQLSGFIHHLVEIFRRAQCPEGKSSQR